MTTYAKPSVLPAWGETNTTAADMVQPATATIQTGFPLSATPPARQTFNWLFNWCANAIRYLMQRGLVDYDAGETYGLNARLIGDDGNTYVSLQSGNTGNAPSTSPLWWARWGLKMSDIPAAPSLAGYAPLASPVFTGNPTAPTPGVGDNDTSLATTAFVQTAVANAAPNLSGYAPLASPALTGNPTAPTPAAADNDTSIATTAFVKTATAGLAATSSLPISPTFIAYQAFGGTYNTPAGARALRIRMIGAGGGGAGSGTAGGGNGGNGGATTFGTLIANGGGGGSASLGPGGTGGTASGGGLNFTGAAGGMPVTEISGSSTGTLSSVTYLNVLGGPGAGSVFSGPTFPTNTGVAGGVGAGGSGAGNSGSTGAWAGSGGGAGGYVETWIPAPSASYSYNVGTGGTAGTAGASGQAGGAGGAGMIIVEAF